MVWTSDSIRRIILDMAGRLGQSPPAGPIPPGRLDLGLDLGLTSIQRMELAAQLNEFFGIFHTDATNYLLASPDLDHWIDCIRRARAQDNTYLTFRTSGSTGQSRPIRHKLADLETEVSFLATLLPRPAQVLTTVPANHIYGFLFTVLLPAHWACPVRQLTELGPAGITSDTLIVGTPFTWEYLYRSVLQRQPVACAGVCSTAPLPAALFTQLQQSGLTLTEIYGSSDTGGLAYRQQPTAPFTLFPYLDLGPGDAPAVSRNGTDVPLPDRIERLSPRQFRVLGRLDQAVSIAGINVYPAHIRSVISACPLVDDCDIFAKAIDGRVQLFGAIRLRQLNAPNEAAARRWLRDRLSDAEIPTQLYFY